MQNALIANAVFYPVRPTAGEKSTGLFYYRILWVVFCRKLCDKLCRFVYHKDTEYP